MNVVRPTRRSVVSLALSAFLVACGEPPTPEDREALTSLWEPVDGSGQTVEFKADGIFHYFYVPDSHILEFRWTLLHPGEVQLSTVGGEVIKNCFYTIADDMLHIDDGSGRFCTKPATTPPRPMPLDYRRAAQPDAG